MKTKLTWRNIPAQNILAVLIFLLISNHSLAALTCTDETLERLKFVSDLDLTQYACTLNRAPSINPNDYIVTLVPHNPDEKSYYYLSSSVSMRQIVGLDFRNQNPNYWSAMLVSEIFKTNKNIQSQCVTDAINSIQLSVQSVYEMPLWNLRILTPFECQVRESITHSGITKIWQVSFLSGSSYLKPDGNWSTDSLKYKKELRQSFTPFLAESRDFDFIRKTERAFFPRCRKPYNLKPYATNSAVYSINQFEKHENNNRLAIHLDTQGIIPYYALKTEEQNRPHSIILEKLNKNSKAEAIGAWSINNVNELKNLVIENSESITARVKIKDLECGEDFVSNWTEIKK
jgi:hypothetical protein